MPTSTRISNPGEHTGTREWLLMQDEEIQLLHVWRRIPSSKPPCARGTLVCLETWMILHAPSSGNCNITRNYKSKPSVQYDVIHSTMRAASSPITIVKVCFEYCKVLLTLIQHINSTTIRKLHLSVYKSLKFIDK